MVTSESVAEVLDLIVEECGEIVVARSKLKRFGPDSVDPRDPTGPNNEQAMVNELLDVHALISKLISRCVALNGLTPGAAKEHAVRKIASVKAHHPSLANLL
jgi:hypothetical protein